VKSITESSLHRDLGINTLTGEACAFSMRILCDLNVDGVALMTDYLGLDHSVACPFPPNMNSMVGEKPSIASCMIERSAFPALIRFSLFRRGYQYVLQAEDSWAATGFYATDVQSGHYDLSMVMDGTSSLLKQNGGHLLLYRNPKGGGGQPSVGDRNVHAFTGRTL
jgi:hypothetical protein